MRSPLRTYSDTIHMNKPTAATAMTVRVAFGLGDGGAVGDEKAERGGMRDEMVRIHIACCKPCLQCAYVL
jgi:hypothetical protein